VTTAPEHALYEGTVWHRRTDPAYAFRTPVMLALLDLDHLDTAWRVHPLVSDRPGRPVRFDRRDYAGDPTLPLAQHVRDLVEQHLGTRPEGRVRMLAGLRTFGRCFNPIVVHWCEDGDGRVVAQVLDVTNTPWGERHSYVLDTRTADADGWSVTATKALHVSPFLPMDLHHSIRSRPPGDRITMTIDDRDAADAVVFHAGLALARRPFDRPTVTHYLTRHAFASQRVTGGIYWHALRLLGRGAPFHPHPHRREDPVAAR
jgi:DUF1365 family protein